MKKLIGLCAALAFAANVFADETPVDPAASKVESKIEKIKEAEKKMDEKMENKIEKIKGEEKKMDKKMEEKIEKLEKKEKAEKAEKKAEKKIVKKDKVKNSEEPAVAPADQITTK